MKVRLARMLGSLAPPAGLGSPEDWPGDFLAAVEVAFRCPEPALLAWRDGTAVLSPAATDLLGGPWFRRLTDLGPLSENLLEADRRVRASGTSARLEMVDVGSGEPRLVCAHPLPGLEAEVGGVLFRLVERAADVRFERLLQAMERMVADPGQSGSAEEALSAGVEALAEVPEVERAVLYLTGGGEPRLAAEAGGAGVSGPWPIAEVVRTGAELHVDGPDGRAAHVLPLPAEGMAGPAGVLLMVVRGPRVLQDPAWPAFASGAAVALGRLLRPATPGPAVRTGVRATPRVAVAAHSAFRDGLLRALRPLGTVEASAPEAIVTLVPAPDVIVVDLGEAIDSRDLVRTLRSTGPLASAVIAVVAASGSAREAAGLVAAGADEVVPRLTRPAELRARLRGRLGAARRRDEALRRERAARQDAEGANRSKDEFLAMVSHELRTPLGAILIWTQLLKNERLDEAATERALGMIERSTKTLAQIIDDLLDVSRIITGKLSIDPRPVDLAAVVGVAVASAQPSADAKDIRLELRAERNLDPVLGDAGRLQQVIANLLSNAIKFTGSGGAVEVALERGESHVRLRVRDNGRGISPEFLPYIFERFRQADSTSTRAEKGLGLGLTIARHLVELHGGSVEAESQGEGRGAVFTVTLPMVGRPLERAPEPPALERTGGLRGVRVLVVDDDEDAREGLSVLLGQWGAEVCSASSVAEAMGELERGAFDVLLSDIAMPGEDGYSLIRRVRGGDTDARRLPAAALTAYATSEDRSRALGAGFDDHVAKPVDPRHLLAVVARLTSRA